MEIKQRLEKIKSVGQLYNNQYDNDRMIRIYKAFEDLDDDSFLQLRSEVVNTCRFIPLLEDWYACKRKLGLESIAVRDESCPYCRGNGWASAIEKGTEKNTDFFGYPSPVLLKFVCVCISGENIKARRFSERDRENYILLREK